MTIKIAINGYGRIGRNLLRAIYEYQRHQEVELVAINDLGDLKTHAHLTQYDSIHGKFPGTVSTTQDELMVNHHKIKVFSEPAPEKLPWQALGVEIVFECTGRFANKTKAAGHLAAGAQKVLISAPAGEDLPTIVYGINHQNLKKEDSIVSNASCTTNCLALLVKPLQDTLGIVSGLMTTIHAYTNDQVLTDRHHKDLRRARAATQSLIPTETGAAKAIGLVLPELKGKLEGLAIRVPTPNVSALDLTFIAARDTEVKEVNEILETAARGALQGILSVNQEPLVSIDFNHHPASAIFDATQTKVQGRLVKVLAWYDNEWAFCNRMIDTALAMAKAH
jgi:glyceraldehyde 3-phosphate dehydrogenase